jgi:nucleotide-binding universal stress UspA family protein
MANLFKKILCPIDFSANSLAALDCAVSLARQNAAAICLLNVVPSPTGSTRIPPIPLEPFPVAEQTARQRLEEIAKQRLEGKLHYQIATRNGDPATEIIDAVTALGADLVVMATHGRTGLGHLFIGSVAERVVRESPEPVLTVRPKIVPGSEPSDQEKRG